MELERPALKVIRAVLDCRDLRVQLVQLAWQDRLELAGCQVIQEVPEQQVVLGQLDQLDLQDWLGQVALLARWDLLVILDLLAYLERLVILDQSDLPEHPEQLD